MSNLIGDFFTGATMVGADPDSETTGPWRATITGKTRFIAPKLTVASGLSATIVGRTRFTASFTQGATRAPLSGTIVGHSTITGSPSNFYRVQLGATIVGSTTFPTHQFGHEVQFDFQGTVGAATIKSLLIHGQVLSGTGVVKQVPYEDEPQPVHFFV